MSRLSSSCRKPTFCAGESRSPVKRHASRRNPACGSASSRPLAIVIDKGANWLSNFSLGRPLPMSAPAPDWKWRSSIGPAFLPSGALDENP